MADNGLVAIISDIHSNLEALETVIAEIDRRGIDVVVCLGDLVGYNANPNECVQIIRDREVPTVMGNHDIVACGLEEPLGFNPVAYAAALWTREGLTAGNTQYIQNLPDNRAFNDGLLAVHGAPSDRDTYLFTPDDTVEQFAILDNQGVELCFFGHTHFPCVFKENDGSLEHGFQTFTLEEGERYLINPGSVGQPRDSDAKASFVVFDAGNLALELVRLEYDIESAAAKIHESDLPDYLADRLALGR
ncbi:metallophosphoesterase family protein [Candidatus Hydrogenedentota bacterium]